MDGAVLACLLLLLTSPWSHVVTVQLTPRAPDPQHELMWFPKGAKVPLDRHGAALDGALALGPAGSRPIGVRLSRTPGAAHFDVLDVDVNRDGTFEPVERVTSVPAQKRAKW
jgi:hypothetical protein